MTKNEPFWLVTADTQLGDIPWGNTTREEDYYKAFQTICWMAAADPACRGVIGLGDLRERAAIQARNLGGMNRGLKILLEHNKGCLAIMGNHDRTIPNWIEEMCYPCLHNLANPQTQKAWGMNPEETLALDYVPKTELKAAILAACNPRKIKRAFLHQSLKDLTTSLKQSHDTSLEELRNLGFGEEMPCLIMLGDLHNYGDCNTEDQRLVAVYPGSPEMTDINEGIRGLRSQRLDTEPGDHRKFVLKYFPESNRFDTVELKPRPWFCARCKTARETNHAITMLKAAAKSWEKPGLIGLAVPQDKIEETRETIREIACLEARVDTYQPEEEEKQEETQTQGTLNWEENKKALLALAEEENLEPEALALLKEIIAHDGATHNPKNDVRRAWEAWQKPQKENPAKPQTQ
jgi:DNA repair exonuclease SbcCD nuclease subunit